MQNSNSDDGLKYSASVRLNDDRSARIAALQAEIEAHSARSNAVEHHLATARATFERLKDAFVSEIEAHSARSNAVEHHLATARATFERLKGAFVFQHDVIERQRLRDARQLKRIAEQWLHIDRLQNQVAQLHHQVATDQDNLELQRIEIERLNAELGALSRNRDILEIELRAREAELAAIVNTRGYRALQLGRRVFMALRRPAFRSTRQESDAHPPPLPAPLEEPEPSRVSESVAPQPPAAAPGVGEVASSPAEPLPAAEHPWAVAAPSHEGQSGEEELELNEAALPSADAFHWPELELNQAALPSADAFHWPELELNQAALPSAAAFHWPELEVSELPPASQRTLAAAVQYRPRVRRHAFVVLPIIDWDFRFQRPQQIARQLAASGHPVFYLRMTFSRVAKRRELHPGVIELALPGPVNLDPYRDSLDAALARRLAAVIALELRRDAIGCAVSLVQLPFWRPLALALRDLLAMPVIYDCMDEHAGFSTNGAAMLAERTRWLPRRTSSWRPPAGCSRALQGRRMASF